jgi:hypothetical protein
MTLTRTDVIAWTCQSDLVPGGISHIANVHVLQHCPCTFNAFVVLRCVVLDHIVFRFPLFFKQCDKLV